MATSGHPTFILTPIDNSMPRNYVPKVLFFPESPGTNVSTMVDTLRDGLSKTLDAIEPLSGTIQAFGQQGGLCVTAPWNSVDDIFHVKDLTHEERLEYQNIKENHFFLESSHKKLLFPTAIFVKIEKTVMFAEVNIIKGGLIMVLCLHHSFTDGSGTVAITKAWAANCRGDDSSQCIRPETMDRERLMRGWGSASLADFPEFASGPIEKKAPSPIILTHIVTKFLGWMTARLGLWTPNAPPNCENALFFFPKQKLAELKQMASTQEGAEKGDGWVSTNDALCALIGSCVSDASDKEGHRTIDGSCEVGVTVGGRRLLDPPLPADYIGNILFFVRVAVSNHSIDSMETKIAKLAHLIRSQIKQHDERYLGKLISALSSVEDFAKVAGRPRGASRPSVGISSWANQGFYDIIWGDAIGAGIERVRFYYHVKNLCIILPQLDASKFAGDQCGLEVVIGLEKGQIERLKKNEFFMRFAEWRG